MLNRLDRKLRLHKEPATRSTLAVIMLGLAVGCSTKGSGEVPSIPRRDLASLPIGHTQRAVIRSRPIELIWSTEQPLRGKVLIGLPMFWENGEFWGYLGHPFSDAQLRGLCSGSGDIVVALETQGTTTLGDVTAAVDHLVTVLDACDHRRVLVIYVLTDVLQPLEGGR